MIATASLLAAQTRDPSTEHADRFCLLCFQPKPILGSLSEAQSVTIWTDVDGVLTGDPRVVNKARMIEQMTYDEAIESLLNMANDPSYTGKDLAETIEDYREQMEESE